MTIKKQHGARHNGCVTSCFYRVFNSQKAEYSMPMVREDKKVLSSVEMES